MIRTLLTAFMAVFVIASFTTACGEVRAGMRDEYIPALVYIPVPNISQIVYEPQAPEVEEVYVPEEVAAEIVYAESADYIPAEHRPMVALTFDDGPARYTSYILDTLELHGARATFCVLGDRVVANGDVIRRIAATGSELVGHSWDHSNFALLNEESIKWQIIHPHELIEAELGFQIAPIFRAPYGIVTADVRSIAEELGFSMLHWSLDTQDWLHRCADHLYDFIMEHVVGGSIILMHDIRPTTMEAMERVIPSLIERGFQLVTATELLLHFNEELLPGVVYTGVR